MQVLNLNVGSTIFKSGVWELMLLSQPLSVKHDDIELERGEREFDHIDLVNLVDLDKYGPSARLYWLPLLENYNTIRDLMLDKQVIEKRLFSWGDRCLLLRPSPLYDDPDIPHVDPNYVLDHMDELKTSKYGIDDPTIYALGVDILDACMFYLNKNCVDMPSYKEVYAALKKALGDPTERLDELVRCHDVSLLQELSPEYKPRYNFSAEGLQTSIIMSKEGPQRTAIISRCFPAEEVPNPFGVAARILGVVYASVHGSPETSYGALEWLKKEYTTVVVGIDSNLKQMKPVLGYNYTPPFTTVRRLRSIFQAQRNKAGYVTRSGSDRICCSTDLEIQGETMLGEYTAPSETWPFDHNAVSCRVEQH